MKIYQRKILKPIPFWKISIGKVKSTFSLGLLKSIVAIRILKIEMHQSGPMQSQHKNPAFRLMNFHLNSTSSRYESETNISTFDCWDIQAIILKPENTLVNVLLILQTISIQWAMNFFCPQTRISVASTYCHFIHIVPISTMSKLTSDTILMVLSQIRYL